MNNQKQRKRPLVFIIMPFKRVDGKEGRYRPMRAASLDKVYAIYKDVFEKHGYEVRRSDSTGAVLRDIVIDLERADIVVTDVTGLNPNVMYELGIRHGFAKPTILLTQDLKELPFDLSNYYAIRYKWTTEKSKEKLRQSVSKVIEQINVRKDIRFGPVDTFLDDKSAEYRDIRNQMVLRRLKALQHELVTVDSSTDYLVNLLEKRYPKHFKRVETGFEISTSVEMHADRFEEWKDIYEMLPKDFPATDLLLSERYIPDEYNFEGQIDHFIKILSQFKYGISSGMAVVISFLKVKVALRCLLTDIERITRALELGNEGMNLNLVCPHYDLGGLPRIFVGRQQEVASVSNGNFLK